MSMHTYDDGHFLKVQYKKDQIINFRSLRRLNLDDVSEGD